jgi:hypothetical protein
MRRRKLSAGDIIEARCTKCRAVTNHRIVAMVEGKVVRVECNTCGGVHNYYPPERERKAPSAGSSVSVGRKKESVPRKTVSSKGAADLAEWESLRADMKEERAIPYDMGGKFKAGDLVRHPVFGLGVVKAVIVPNKMDVLFQDGRKMLRCKA